jgi:hypothetical protein
MTENRRGLGERRNNNSESLILNNIVKIKSLRTLKLQLKIEVQEE